VTNTLRKIKRPPVDPERLARWLKAVVEECDENLIAGGEAPTVETFEQYNSYALATRQLYGHGLVLTFGPGGERFVLDISRFHPGALDDLLEDPIEPAPDPRFTAPDEGALGLDRSLSPLPGFGRLLRTQARPIDEPAYDSWMPSGRREMRHVEVADGAVMLVERDCPPEMLAALGRLAIAAREHYTGTQAPEEQDPDLRRDRVLGALYGAAYGDALGADLEFMGWESIKRATAGRTARLRPGLGGAARVTDDTQMMMAVGAALADADRELEAQSEYGVEQVPGIVAGALISRFRKWYRDPQNNRAPGGTCMAACRALSADRDVDWRYATQVSSKGNGAVMRAAPVGLAPLGSGQSAIAQLQAAITHGHPTALAAASLTATAVYYLAVGGERAGLLGHLQAHADAMRGTYHSAYLGDLWKRAGYPSPEAYLRHGWNECQAVLGRVYTALQRAHDIDLDPADEIGRKWTAENTLGLAVLAFLRAAAGGADAVLVEAVRTTGDADTVGCVAGALAGAHFGLSGFPAEWRDQIEYSVELGALGEALL
jgi:ADP-ribosylglycohydrolase